jgi:DNA-binding NarL/FixJ family response regulator
VGRADEQAVIDALLDRTAAGVGGVVLLEGDPGIGKSALVGYALRRARSLGDWDIRDAGADELEGERPFALVCEAFPEVRPHITSAIGTAGGLALALPSRLEVADLLVALAEDLRAAHPVVLLVDDLQWADTESLFVLAALARRAAVLGIATLGVSRHKPRPLELGRLVDVSVAAGGHHARVGPLDDADVRTLAATLVRETLPPDVVGQLGGAGGNPWLVVELVRHATTAPPGGRAADDLPPDVHRAVARRMEDLAADAAGWVRIASILGQRFRLEALEAITGAAAGPLATAIAAAVEAGLLEEAGDRLQFRHDLVRQSLEASLLAPVRASLHRQAAVVLRGLGASPLEVAPHVTRGALPGDTDAFQWLLEAAKDAELSSAGAAADLLGHAARICTDDARRDDVQAIRARFLVWAGRPADASEVCTDLVARVRDPDVRADANAVQARALFLLGRASEAAQLLEGDVARDRPGVGSTEQLAWAESALVTLFAGGHRRAAEIAGSVLASPAPEAPATSLARSVRAWTSAIAGDLVSARLDVDAAVSLAHADPTGIAFRYHPHLFQAIVLNALTDTPGALLAIRTGRAIGVRLATGWDRAMYDWAESVVAFHAGRWQDALALGDAGALAAEECGLALGASWHVAIGAVVALRTGDVAGAREWLDRTPRAAGAGQLGLEWLAWANALRAEASGDLDAASAVLGGSWQLATALGADSVLTLFGTDVFRVATATGDAARAAEVVEAIARIASRPCGSASGLHAGRAERVAALFADGDPERLGAAVDLLRTGHRPYELADAMRDAAIAWAAAGEKVRARAIGRDAVDVFEDMGATPTASRLRSELRALGVPIRHREGRSHATEGWESLTRSERAIVELVAQGLSNAQIADQLFVSRRTVESHLVHVYPKLGARSRVELARQVAEHASSP